MASAIFLLIAIFPVFFTLKLLLQNAGSIYPTSKMTNPKHQIPNKFQILIFNDQN
jgi:hypothetical protein